MSARSRPANVAATVVLLLVHGFLLAATVVLLGLLVMGTDPCGEVKCVPIRLTRTRWLTWSVGSIEPLGIR